jgi:beta-glucosidase
VPVRGARGFARVRLKPGERRDVTARVDRRSLSYWEPDTNRWVTPAGDVPVYVGSSSRNIRLAGRLSVR